MHGGILPAIIIMFNSFIYIILFHNDKFSVPLSVILIEEILILLHLKMKEKLYIDYMQLYAI